MRSEMILNCSLNCASRGGRARGEATSRAHMSFPPASSGASRSLAAPPCRSNFAIALLRALANWSTTATWSAQTPIARPSSACAWPIKGELPWAKPCVERYSAASAVVGGKVWLMGGLVTEEDDEEDEENEEERTASVSIYDPSLDSWAMGPPLPRAVRGCWATVRAGEIHVGYQDDPGRVFMYRGGAWEEHAAELDIEGAAACNPIILG